MIDTVEMRPAYEWTCHECGRDNFESCIVAEMSEEDREAMNLDNDDGVECELVTYPDVVVCDQCSGVFTTVDREQE